MCSTKGFRTFRAVPFRAISNTERPNGYYVYPQRGDRRSSQHDIPSLPCAFAWALCRTPNHSLLAPSTLSPCSHCSVFPPVSTREHHSAFLRIVGTATQSQWPRRSSRPRLFSARCQPSRPRPCPRLCTRAANSGSQLSPAYKGSLRAFSTYWLVFGCCIL